jgi:hypothetical protein
VIFPFMSIGLLIRAVNIGWSFEQLILFAFFGLWFIIVSCVTLVYGWQFYSAIWSPFRWMSRHLRSFFALPNAVATYVVRVKGWSVLQRIALGLEGYQHAVPQLAQQPGYIASNLVQLQDLPSPVKNRVMKKRRVDIGEGADGVADILSAELLTSPEITKALKAVFRKVSLIHAAYYVEDECVDMIAEWIAERPATATKA